MDPLPTLDKTLRQHYEAKRAHYGVDRPAFYDRDLRRLFSDAPEHAPPADRGELPGHATAARCASSSARWTNDYQYTIDQVLDDMIARCRELNLRLTTTAGAGEDSTSPCCSPCRR